MKTSLLAAAAVAFVAVVGVPATAEAGGLHRLCPTQWLKDHHHYHAKKAVAVKKVAAKPAKKVVVKKAAAKPLK